MTNAIPKSAPKAKFVVLNEDKSFYPFSISALAYWMEILSIVASKKAAPKLYKIITEINYSSERSVSPNPIMY